MNRLKVAIGGVEILGAPNELRAVRGLFIKKDGLQGIDDGVSVRRESVEIPGGHGEFDLPVTRGPRAITLSGIAAEKSLFDLGRLRAQLMGVGADGSLFRIEVEHQTENTWMQGRLAATPVFKDRGGMSSPYLADFEMQIVCPDPRKYGATRSTTGGQTAVNFGNFPATPSLITRGVSGSNGYTITTERGEIIISVPLTVGKSHRIDMNTGSVYDGETRLTGALARFRPWTVPPGDGLVHSVTAGVDLTVETTDTWI